MGPDHFVLRDWDYQPNISEEWNFVRDYDRYGDRLLHCTVSRDLLRRTFIARGPPSPSPDSTGVNCTVRCEGVFKALDTSIKLAVDSLLHTEEDESIPSFQPFACSTAPSVGLSARQRDTDEAAGRRQIVPSYNVMENEAAGRIESVDAHGKSVESVASAPNATGDSTEATWNGKDMSVPPILDESVLSRTERLSLDRVACIHYDLDHASSYAMERTVVSENKLGVLEHERLGVTTDEIRLWRQYREQSCIGCLRGKMIDHHHYNSQKHVDYPVGTAGHGDLMFVEQAPGKSKKAFLLHVDHGSKTIIAVSLASKTAPDLLDAYKGVQSRYESYDHALRDLYFDRYVTNL